MPALKEARWGRGSANVPSTRSWRATTAVRVFALALVIGQSLSVGQLTRSGSVVFVLLLVAAVSVALEVGVIQRRTPWIPVVEGVLVGTLLTTSLPVESLLVYLAVPAVVAGLRHGWVTTVNTTLSTTAAVIAASSDYRGLGLDTERVVASTSWLVIGLGAGLLAAWQSRSVRRLEAAQAPYAAAHTLLTQLHSLAQRGKIGLDSGMVANEVAATIGREAEAESTAIFVLSPGDVLEPFLHPAERSDLARIAARCQEVRSAISTGPDAAMLLRSETAGFGVLALHRARGWTDRELVRLQENVDRHALRLETALLFDDVRLMATSEERSRLAREMHDGIAQEIAALGYLVDEIESETAEATTLAVTSALRQELSRVAGDLRYSIFDLRHEMSDQHLAPSLADYVRELGASSGLQVHLVLDDQAIALPRRTEVEILRIAQEALSNVRKHAHALNVWVSLVAEEQGIVLRVADDGIGSVAPRPRHFGLHTMQERADRIDAALTIAARPGGGTVVTLTAKSPATIGASERVEHQSPAGR